MKRLLILILMSLSACANSQARDEPVAAPTSKYAVELTEQEKKLMPKWLEYDCSVDFKKSGQYQKCVAMITRTLPPLDSNKREHFGEVYNPERYYECRLKTTPNNVSCDRYRLRRPENPAFWPYPDVPSPKFPAPPNPPVYKAGMSAKQYFDALCKAEAGDFIYKTVEDVEGIYQIRPQATSYEGGDDRMDRFVMEDPYGYRQWLSDRPHLHFADAARAYEFFETSAAGRLSGTGRVEQTPDPDTIGPNPKGKYYRYFGTPPFNMKNSRREAHTDLTSRYGYYWRGIPRPHDRELAIAGGELIILDLQSNEILAIHRGFNLNGKARNPTGIYWGTGLLCPKQEEYDYFYRDFIQRVLVPKHRLTN
jgi:hypothetical protein